VLARKGGLGYSQVHSPLCHRRTSTGKHRLPVQKHLWRKVKESNPRWTPRPGIGFQDRRIAALPTFRISNTLPSRWRMVQGSNLQAPKARSFSKRVGSATCPDHPYLAERGGLDPQTKKVLIRFQRRPIPRRVHAPNFTNQNWRRRRESNARTPSLTSTA
jgi:hypothetical protein